MERCQACNQCFPKLPPVTTHQISKSLDSSTYILFSIKTHCILAQLLFFKTHILLLQVAQCISMALYKHIFLATFILALSLSSNHASLAAHHLLGTPAVSTANFVVSMIPFDLPISSTLHPLPEVLTQPILKKPQWVPLSSHRRNQVATQLPAIIPTTIPSIPIISSKLPTIRDATRTRAKNRRRVYSVAIPSKRELTSNKYGWTKLMGLKHSIANSIRARLERRNQNHLVANPVRTRLQTSEKNYSVANPVRTRLQTSEKNYSVANPVRTRLQTSEKNYSVANPVRTRLQTSEKNYSVANPNRTRFQKSKQNHNK
jgi:hypothetical protein